MIATGNDSNNTPNTSAKDPITLPRNVLGTVSPYPTVVIVIIAHHMASGIF